MAARAMGHMGTCPTYKIERKKKNLYSIKIEYLGNFSIIIYLVYYSKILSKKNVIKYWQNVLLTILYGHWAASTNSLCPDNSTVLDFPHFSSRINTPLPGTMRLCPNYIFIKIYGILSVKKINFFLFEKQDIAGKLKIASIYSGSMFWGRGG